MSVEAVPRDLQSLLIRLMSIPELSPFSLGGGTSLALRFAHRQSMDIDLFSSLPFESLKLQNTLRSLFKDCGLLNRTTGSLCMLVEGIKLDMLHDSSPNLNPVEQFGEVRCLSLSDLAAMKMNAITNRGSKKDFSDLLLLHQHGLEVRQTLDLFCRKYGEEARFLAIRSLLYFTDADAEPDPVYLNGWTWLTVKTDIRNIVQKQLLF